jgi:glycosyltransferase involved in cell wall biosynthesis
MKTIDIVICTHNRLNLLDKNLHTNLKIVSEFSNVFITVVDSNSTDGTIDYLKKMPVRSFFSPAMGLSIARNLAVSNLRSDYLTFLDDDAYLSQSYIHQLLRILDEQNPEIVGGSILPEIDTVFPKWFYPGWETRCKSKVTDFTSGFTFDGSNLTVKSSLFQRIGGFDPKLGMSGKRVRLGEEKDFMKRYFRSGGNKAFYDPSLIVWANVLPFKLRYSYRLKRELAPVTNNLGKINYKILLKPTFFLAFSIRVFRCLKLNNFTPLSITDRFRYKSLVICNAFSTEINKIR